MGTGCGGTISSAVANYPLDDRFRQGWSTLLLPSAFVATDYDTHTDARSPPDNSQSVAE